MDRRIFLGLSAAASCEALVRSGLALAGPLAETTEPSRADWFDQIFGSKTGHGPLHLFRFSDEIYAITRSIGWTPDGEVKYKSVEVPSGFVTDLASIPQIFWSALPRDGKYIFPAIIHDYMYWVQDRPREEADDIFRIGMTEFGISSVLINAIYWSVRAGGGQAWSDNARKKGEKRVLRLYPDSPLTSWAEWKKGNVF